CNRTRSRRRKHWPARRRDRSGPRMRKVLITGGAGFIGSALTLRWAREHPQDRVIVVDALTYAGHRMSLASLREGDFFRFVHGDICNSELVNTVISDEKPDLLLHLAAESHV